MSVLAVTFRQEITRLARKEIRNQTKALRKASAQFRRDVARLKRQATSLKAEVARLERQIAKGLPGRAAESDSAKMRYSAKGLISQRKNLGISAADYGRLVGVTGHTVYKWEHGASRPRRAQLSAIASVRGLGKREVNARLNEMRKTSPKRRAAKR